MGRGAWWYSGEIDLGFSGALRAAATVVVDDPIFDLFAYGGDLERNQKTITVIPKDGLRARFHILRGSQRVHLLLDRDGFAAGPPITFDVALHKIAFTLENRSGDRHETRLHLAGLPPGAYRVMVEQREAASFTSRDREDQAVDIAVALEGARVAIERVR
jgi:hypothetical protein